MLIRLEGGEPRARSSPSQLFSSPGSAAERAAPVFPIPSRDDGKSGIVSPPPRSRTASRGVIKYFETDRVMQMPKERESAAPSELLMTFAHQQCLRKQMQPAAIINGERLYFCASNFISPSVSTLKMRRFSAGLSKAFQTCYYYSSGWVGAAYMDGWMSALFLSICLCCKSPCLLAHTHSHWIISPRAYDVQSPLLFSGVLKNLI